MAQKSVTVEPLDPQNQWIADAFIGVEADIPVVYDELQLVLKDGKITILEAIEVGLILPNPIKHVSAAVKAIRALKFLSGSQENAVLLAVAGDGGEITVGMHKAKAIIAYVDQLALSIDKQFKQFAKLKAALKAPVLA